LYTDILSPQPPFHLWTGSLLVRLTEWLGADPLLFFRVFTLVVRLFISATVGTIAFLLYRKGSTALLASVILLLLPEGYRWSQGYQSEHLELLFLCIGLALALWRKGWSRTLAPCLGVCAMWTNMSSLPFAFLLLLIAMSLRPFRWAPLVATLATLAILLGISLSLAGQAYFENVWSNQVASIPTDPGAWAASLMTEGTAIVELEGLYILLALFAIWNFLRSRRAPDTGGTEWSPLERSLISLYGIASIGSAIYVVKGGTVDYIFMLAEPMIAVFAAASIVSFLVRGDAPGDTGPESSTTRVLRWGSYAILGTGLLLLLLWKPVQFNSGVARQSAPGVDLRDTYEGRIVEFSDLESQTLLRVIDHLSGEGETVWAPPFFAALAKRPIAMDLSETYLWYVRWQHSVFGKKEDAAVARMISGLTEAIEETRLPMLLLNSRTGQWGHLLIPDLTLRLPTSEGGSEVFKVRELDPRLDRLQNALEEGYRPLLAAPGSTERLYFQGMNERLEVWVPKSQEPYLPPWSRIGFSGS
jgi:hypothetical protein